MVEILHKTKATIFGSRGALLCVSWAGGNQISAVRICLPVWEQIISQPGWDVRRQINTENAPSWSPKLGSVLCYLPFPQRPMLMLYKSRFYFSMSFSKTLQHRVYSWQIVAVGWAALGVFPKNCAVVCLVFLHAQAMQFGGMGKILPARPAREAEQLCRGCSEQSASPGADSL